MQKAGKLFLRLPCGSFRDVTGDTQSCSAHLIGKQEDMFLGKTIRFLVHNDRELHCFSPGLKFLMGLLHSATLHPSLASRKRSASIAAMQPDPAAVTAWRYVESCTSPAANMPGIVVAVPWWVRI